MIHNLCISFLIFFAHSATVFGQEEIIAPSKLKVALIDAPVDWSSEYLKAYKTLANPNITFRDRTMSLAEFNERWQRVEDSVQRLTHSGEFHGNQVAWLLTRHLNAAELQAYNFNLYETLNGDPYFNIFSPVFQIFDNQVSGSMSESIRKYFEAVSQVIKKEKIRVVNLSIGRKPSFDRNIGLRFFFAMTALDRYEEALENAISKMVTENPDTIFVKAAGNNHANLNNRNQSGSRYIRRPNQIVVGALDNWTKGLANFSNFGDNYVDVAASGSDIHTPFGEEKEKEKGNETVDGTSFAAPMVANRIADILTREPHLTVQQAIATFYDKYTVSLKTMKNGLVAKNRVMPSLEWKESLSDILPILKIVRSQRSTKNPLYIFDTQDREIYKKQNEGQGLIAPAMHAKYKEDGYLISFSELEHLEKNFGKRDRTIGLLQGELMLVKGDRLIPISRNVSHLNQFLNSEIGLRADPCDE